MRRQSGIGLVSVIVLIVGIGVIVAVAAPIAIMMIQEARFRATLHEMESLKEAIALYHPGEERGFGFVGDIGRFPTSLTELVERGTLPLWDVTTGIGWRGPYVKRGFAEDPNAFQRDGWGNLYIYPDTLIHPAAAGIITSLGSDGARGGAGYAADFSTLALTHLRVGIIRGQIRDVLGSPLPNVVVSVKEPVDGISGWRGDPGRLPAVTTNAAGFYSLPDVIVGRRRLRATFGGFTHFFYSEVTPHIEARADFRIARDITIPGAPTALTATPTVFGGIGLEWLPPTLNIDGTNLTDLAGFNIYRYRQESFPPTLIWNRIATLGLVHFFYDDTVSSHFIYHYIVRAFDRAGNESAGSDPPVSANTANITVNFDPATGATGVIGNIRNGNRVIREAATGVGARRIMFGMRNFSDASITVTNVMVSWTGTTPVTYSGTGDFGIRTRIPTTAGWTFRHNVATSNGVAVTLSPAFTLDPYGTTPTATTSPEGIFGVGFNATMPTTAIITVVFNPQHPIGDHRRATIVLMW